MVFIGEITEGKVASVGGLFFKLGIAGVVLWFVIAMVQLFLIVFAAYAMALILYIVEAIFLYQNLVFVRSWADHPVMSSQVQRANVAVHLPLSICVTGVVIALIFGFWTWFGILTSLVLFFLASPCHIALIVSGQKIRACAKKINEQGSATLVVSGSPGGFVATPAPMAGQPVYAYHAGGSTPYGEPTPYGAPAMPPPGGHPPGQFHPQGYYPPQGYPPAGFASPPPVSTEVAQVRVTPDDRT